MVASISATQVWVWSVRGCGLGYRLSCGCHRHDVCAALPLGGLYSAGSCQDEQVIVQPYTTNICTTLVDGVGYTGGGGGGGVVAWVSWVDNVGAILVD